MGHNRRMSSAPFACPVFAGGALGTLSACHATGQTSQGVGAIKGGVLQQTMGMTIDITAADVIASRASSGGSSGGGAGESLNSGGTTYARGWWIVPTTRRVRGTTITGTVGGGDLGGTGGGGGGGVGGDRGGDAPGSPSTGARGTPNLGGLIVYSGTDRDIVFIEPARAGEPTGPVEIQLTTLDGRSIGGSEKLLRGCYYIIADDAKGVRLSRAYPWTSSAASPHDPAARAVFDALRKAAIASGKPGMANLPDLVGP